MRQPLLWANLLGSLAAVVGNVWAARVGQSEHRTMRYSVATIAALFAGLYASDLTGLLGPDLRSEIAAGIAPVAWIVAWTVPAVRSATSAHEARSFPAAAAAFRAAWLAANSGAVA